MYIGKNKAVLAITALISFKTMDNAKEFTTPKRAVLPHCHKALRRLHYQHENKDNSARGLCMSPTHIPPNPWSFHYPFSPVFHCVVNRLGAIHGCK